MVSNRNACLKILSVITAVIGVAMLVPLFVALSYKEYHVVKSFGICSAALLILGAAGIFLLPKTDTNELKMRDGIFTVVLAWFLVSLYGSFPFMLSGDLPNFFDAFFESLSGYTTTGSTLLEDVTVLSRGILFWRSFNHWLGGMGLLFMAIVILPMFGVGGSKLLQAESTGPLYSSEDFSARKAAIKMYVVYLVVTVTLYALLRFGGLNPFDAAVHMFGTMGTGGYSCYNTSIGTFDSEYVDYVVSVFMLICSINFALVVTAFSGKIKKALRDAELKFFLLCVVIATVFTTFMLWKYNCYPSFREDLRYAFFQVCSLISSSGYSTGTIGFWPVPCKMVLFVLMLIGGCAASTSGGFKVIRVLLIGKILVRNVKQKFHRSGYYPITVNGKKISEKAIRSVMAYSIAYILCCFAGTILLCCDGADLHTAIAAAVSSLSNIGPDYWFDGSAMCFGMFSAFGKMVSAALMFIGRLEFLSIMMLFTPGFRDN